MINIHPHIESKPIAEEIKQVTGEINPEMLPDPQRQSSSFSSSFNTANEIIDASSTNEVTNTLRRRDTDENNVHPRTRVKRQLDPNAPSTNQPVYILPHDGIYLLVVYVGAPSNTQTFTASVHVEVGLVFYRDVLDVITIMFS